MGSSSSTLSSEQSHVTVQSMATARTIGRPRLSIGMAESMSQGYSSSSKSQIINEEVIQQTQKRENDTIPQTNSISDDNVTSSITSFYSKDTNNSVIETLLKVQLLPAIENADGKNEDHEQFREELNAALEELSLSDHEIQSALQLLKQNPKLAEHMKICKDCILSFKSSSQWACLLNLGKLESMFFNINYVERAIIGEFLTYMKFCQKSYAKYMSVLRAHGSEHFSDSLLDSEDVNNVEIGNILNDIRNLWWNFSDASSVFAAQIASEVSILQEMHTNIISLIGVDGKILKNSTTFESAMGILHNVARLSNSRQIFREMKFVDILANFLSYEDQPKVTMLVLMVLAHIIDEDQTDLLTSHDSVFDLMILLSKRAWRVADHRCDGFSVEELIEAMTGLSRNDTVKIVLVKKGILTLVLNTLTEGSEKEQEVSMKLLWELSFDPDNRIKIQQVESMMQTVKNLSKHTNKNTAKSAQGVLLVMGMEKEKEQSKGKRKQKSANDSKGSMGHVMISYNWMDQKKLMEIRDFLRNHGYKIWMDIDNIRGSTLQAMAEAVEEADVVLVCMSETYKESLNCRSEAEYAFSLQKPIIPLLMQSQYKPNGWLGMLLGTKLFFNFSGKYPFEKKIDELVKEIGSRGQVKDGTSQDSIDGAIIKEVAIPLGKTPDKPHLDAPLNVQDWIKEHNLTEYTELQSLSSEHLRFMKKLSLRAPEFYYSFVLDLMSGKMSTKDLTGLMMVTSALENIPK